MILCHGHGSTGRKPSMRCSRDGSLASRDDTWQGIRGRFPRLLRFLPQFLRCIIIIIIVTWCTAERWHSTPSVWFIGRHRKRKRSLWRALARRGRTRRAGGHRRRRRPIWKSNPPCGQGRIRRRRGRVRPATSAGQRRWHDTGGNSDGLLLYKGVVWWVFYIFLFLSNPRFFCLSFLQLRCAGA